MNKNNFQTNFNIIVYFKVISLYVHIHRLIEEFDFYGSSDATVLKHGSKFSCQVNLVDKFIFK